MSHIETLLGRSPAVDSSHPICKKFENGRLNKLKEVWYLYSKTSTILDLLIIPEDCAIVNFSIGQDPSH
jgi:hypothetical protein